MIRTLKLLGSAVFMLCMSYFVKKQGIDAWRVHQRFRIQLFWDRLRAGS